jgi:hypothetical protein
MSIIDEKHRLEPDEWHAAVSRAFHRHDEAHVISTMRAKKHVAELTDMVRECGATGVLNALGSAMKIAAQNGHAAVHDQYLTERNANRVKRFAATLRLRNARDDVRDILAFEAFDDELEAA